MKYENFSLKIFIRNLYLIFLLLQFFSLEVSSYIQKQTYQGQIESGEYSAPLTAVPEQSTDPAQHFLCGYAMREMRMRKMLYNCNCGNRMDTQGTQGVVAYKCDWCQNTFWSMRNGFKAIFCSINDWSSQITKVYETGSIESRNWRQYKCPKGFYVKHAAGRFGMEQESILGMVGMQMICSNLEQNQTVKVEDPSKHCLEDTSENSEGTFVSAVQVKGEKAGKLTGIKWIFEGIAYIKQASIKYGDIVGKSTTSTIQIIQLSKGQNITKKVKLPLTASSTISYMWRNNNPYFGGYKFADLLLMPPQYNMEKDEGLYTAIRSKFGFNTPSTTKFIPSSSIYATINPFSNVTVFAMLEELNTNVTFSMTVKFYDRTTGEFIIEKTIEGVYSGVVVGPISLVFEQKKCIGVWGKNNLIVNGDFEQNKCTRGQQWCVWDKTSIGSSLPGWIPNPLIEIGRGRTFSNLYGDNWMAQLFIVDKASCMQQKLNLGPGLYQMSFDRVARISNPLASNSLEVKFDGKSLKKIYPEDYFSYKQNFQIKLTQPTREYSLEICAIGTGSNVCGVILDNFKMHLYYDCANVQTQKY